MGEFDKDGITNGEWSELGKDGITNGEWSELGKDRITNGEWSELGKDGITNGELGELGKRWTQWNHLTHTHLTQFRIVSGLYIGMGRVGHFLFFLFFRFEGL